MILHQPSVKTHQHYSMAALPRGGFSLHDHIISSLIYLTLISPTHPLFSLLNTSYLLVTLLEQTDNYVTLFSVQMRRQVWMHL